MKKSRYLSAVYRSSQKNTARRIFIDIWKVCRVVWKYKATENIMHIREEGR